MLIGYARVSTQEQETHAQEDALRRAGVNLIEREKRSGGDRRRPVLAAILGRLGPGDVLVVYKLDRVARSLSHLLDVLDHVDRSGAAFRSLTEVIDTGTPSGRMMLHMLGAFAEFERAMIRERTRAGMRAAMDRGVKPGRPRALSGTAERRALRMWRGGQVTVAELARRFGCHASSVRRMLVRNGFVE